MTDQKLLETFTKRYHEYDTLLAEIEKLQKEIVNRVNLGRGKQEMLIRELAAKAKMKMSRVVSVTYNTATLKPSEARALLKVVNG
jgi:hypothetical protein